MNKKELRKKGKELLRSVTGSDKISTNEKIHNHLFQSMMWKEASLIGCTLSQDHEIDTYTIIKQAWKEGKTVAVPKCNPSEKALIFRKLTSFDQLESVYFGLQEPIEEKTQGIERDSIDLMIVPGLIFDCKGYRVGYGGGYYDRYLANFKNTTVALATDSQVTEDVPKDEYDIPVQHLITESGFRF